MRIWALVTALLLVQSAQAGAPMATEDADVLARGECEWESAFERARESGAPTVRAWGTKVGCGWLEGHQAAIGYGRASAAGVHADSFSLGGKSALRARPEGGWGLTLAWELSTLKAPGGSHRFDGSMLALVFTQSFAEKGLLHMNLGTARSRLDDESTRFWALGAEWALNDALDLLAETYGARHEKPQFGVGLRWNASEAWSIGLMASQTRSEPKLKTGLLTVRFGF
ncbi:hypothetical protein HNQ51_002573 [Inhella inkyongensis]|uniref:Outer membrane protein beta-barrel domain-containing protein n=1 Tax=Inhella inkyongensis TaxID=392593 RepID=A0A840S8Z0_9BURK|nr:hypothetical protein [Inhella inkyongensis]MBB5205254.1 hypothetical protein [Inhella inkyongensis]